MALDIQLHGELEEFGKDWVLEVNSAAEAVRAIEANRPGFLDYIRTRKIGFVTVQKGKEVLAEEDVRVITEEYFDAPIGQDESLHLMPVVEGDVETAYMALSVGLNIIGVPYPFSNILAGIIVAAAIVVATIGIARMLAPTPPGQEGEDSKPSYYFGGAQNVVKQGNPCPILYGGPLMVGSQVVSMAIGTQDIGKLRSTAYATIVDVVSEGEIEGYADTNLKSSIYLDKVPVEREGDLNFDEGFEFELKTGTNDQSITTINDGLNAESTYTGINRLVSKASGPVSQSTSNPSLDRIEITINIPTLVKFTDDGDQEKWEIELQWSVQGQGIGSPVVIDTKTIKGKTTSGYYVTYGVDIDTSIHGTHPYTVQVERLNADTDGVKKVSDFYWLSMSEITRVKLRYPNSAYVVTKLDAKFFNTIPGRGFLFKGVKVLVPDNYNPVTRQYSGGWGGNFSTTRQFTNNPAWIFYDLCINDRYGLGEYMDATMVDKWSLYTVAQYCDELVDDGYGGQEPRFTCNVFMQNPGEALNVLRDLASSFRSILFWYNGQLTLSQDTQEDPIAQFSPANVVNGRFEYTGTARHTRFTVALVTYMNPLNNYEPEIEYVEDRAGIALYGIKELSMTAVGCTSRGQANRVGKYALLTSRLETDAVTFKSGLEGMHLMPGRVIKIIDPIKNQSDENVSGRVAAITATSVTLDRPVTLGASTYTITLIQPDGTPVSRPITNGFGTVTPPATINWSASLSPLPDTNSVWSITDDAESEVLYKILSVKEPEKGGDGFYEVSAVMNDPSKYALADSPDPLEGPPIPPLPAPGSQPVQNLTLYSGVIYKPESLIRYIDASWSPPLVDTAGRAFVGYYEVNITDPNDQRETFLTYDPGYRLYNPALGTYEFTVYAISELDYVKSPPAVAQITIEPLTDLDLVEVTGLELVGQGNDTTFEGKDASFQWRMTSSVEGEVGSEEFPGDTGTPPPWFKDFEVTMLDSDENVLRTVYVTDPYFTYSYEMNLADGGPRRYFTIEVRIRDIYNRESDEARLSVSNPAPIGFNSISYTVGIETLIVSITPPDDNDYDRARCYVSQTQGFTPSPENLAYEGSDWTFTISGLTQQIYYVRLEPVDAFGPSGNYTAEQQVTLTTANDILNQLVGEITETELYASLNERIDLIDTGPGALVPRVGQNEADIAQLQIEFNAAISTYYQDTDPQLGVPTPADPAPTLVIGDLWVDTSSADTIKRWNGNGWDALEASGNQVFYRDGPPTAPYDGPSPDPATLSPGDYWIDTGETVPSEANHPYIWNGLSWVSARDGLLTSAAADITVLQATVDDPTTGVAANAVAIDAMQVEVFDTPTLGSNIYAQGQAISGLQVEVSAKNRTFQQADDPDLTYTLTTGDIWIETDNNNKAWRWDGAQWVDATDTSVSGNQTFHQDNAPSIPPAVEGDLWFDTNAANHPYIVAGGIWVSIRDTSSTGNTTYFQPDDPDLTESLSVGDLWFDTDDGNSGWRWNGVSWDSILDQDASGIQTFVQPTAPSATGPGDIWFDSDDGNTVYRYNGSQWINLQDADIAQAIQDAADAQATADGKIITFYQDDPPSAAQASHGDLWIDTNDGNTLYRWNDTPGEWQNIQDGDIQSALANAQNAQDTADGKIISFFQPTAPTAAAVGDLWFDTDDNNHPKRWTGSVWESVRDTFSTGITTHVQPDQPIANAEGDLWFDSDDNNHPYRWDGAIWEDIRDSSSTGITTFYTGTQPTANAVGDLWFDTSNDNKPYRWNGATWDPVSDGTVYGVVAIYSDTAPPSANEGDIWIDTDDDNHPYIYRSGVWVDLLADPEAEKITAAVAIEQYARITADLVGYAEYTVKVDVNGHIAGIGLAVEGGVSGPIQSNIIMLADRFSIGFPTYEFVPSNSNYAIGHYVTPTQAYIDANGTPDANGIPRWDYVYEVTAFTGTPPYTSGSTDPTWPTTPGSSVWSSEVQFTCRDKLALFPFVVGTYNAGTEGSPDWQTGVVINNALIGQASIDGAQIKAATITDANISVLSAGKIGVGTIDIGSGLISLGGSNFTLSSQYRRIDIYDDQATPQLRARLGGLTDSPTSTDWGLSLYNAAGQPILTTQTGIDTDTMGLGNFAFQDQITAGNVGTLISSAAIGSAYIGDLHADKITGDVQRFEVFRQTALPPVNFPSVGWGNWTAWQNVARFRVKSEPFDREIDGPKDMNTLFHVSCVGSKTGNRAYSYGFNCKLTWSPISDPSIYYDIGSPWSYLEQGDSAASELGVYLETRRTISINWMFENSATFPDYIPWPANRDGYITMRARAWSDYTNNPSNKTAYITSLWTISEGQVMTSGTSAFGSSTRMETYMATLEYTLAP